THGHPWLNHARETEHGLEIPTLPERYDFHGYDATEPIMGADKRLYRAAIEVSQYPDAPDYDGTCPVYAVRQNRYGRWSLDAEPVLGTREQDGLPDYAPASFGRFAEVETDSYDRWEIFDRYLKIFHGGSAEVWDTPDGLKYL